MLKEKTSIPPIIFTSAMAIGLSLALISCSPSAPETKLHTEHAHSAEHAAEESQKTVAETHEDHETQSNVRSAESHVHGGAMLAIVSENNRITIEFESPLYNLLGFEYAPRSEAEKARVVEVEKTLADPNSLIKFNADAKCTYLDITSPIELFDEHAEDTHGENHNDDHDDGEHHDDEHDDEHETSENHKDVILNYELTCKAIDKLKTVKVEFFNVFSNFTELELVYLGPAQQLSADLSPSRPNADLTR